MPRTKPGRPIQKLTTWLAIWMARRNVTATMLAAEVGVTKGTISKFRGGGVPLDEAKKKIAAATLAIEHRQGLRSSARGVPITDWFRDPPTEAEARKLVPWAFPEPVPAPASPEPVATTEPEKV